MEKRMEKKRKRMKGIGSFNDLPISAGLLLLAEPEDRDALEAEMNAFLQKERPQFNYVGEARLDVDVAPLIRYLFERLDLDGDYLKIVFCAVCEDRDDIDMSSLPPDLLHTSAAELKLLPRMGRRYVHSIAVTVKGEAESR